MSNPKSQIPNPKKIPNLKSQGGGFEDRSNSYDLGQRLLRFSKHILKLTMKLPKLSECDILRKQLFSSAASIGANYEEGDGSLTKRDLIHKLSIARKEARETIYWLKVISGTFINAEEMDTTIREAKEVKNILSSILNKLRNK